MSDLTKREIAPMPDEEIAKLKAAVTARWDGKPHYVGISPGCMMRAEEILSLIKAVEEARENAAESITWRAADLAAQLAEARDRGLEDAAVWHDYQVSDLEEQIKRNDEYRTRTGNLSAASEANDFCRSLQSSHRISAVAIRALKGKT